MFKNDDSHPEYRPDIDGLRAIAVITAIVYHAFPSLLRGGYTSVDVFFVISGFLISTILFQNIDRGTYTITGFYSRRIRRLFPALVLILITVFIFGWFSLFPDELMQLGKHTASSAGFIQNFTLWGESGYFDNSSETKPLLHIWSLGIEEQFYFIWPILLFVAGKFGTGHKKKYFYLLIILLVFAISFTINSSVIEINPRKTYYLPQYRFWELAVGGIIAWILLYKPKISIKFPGSHGVLLSEVFSKKWIRDAFSFLGLGILFTVFYVFSKNTVLPGGKALLPVIATGLLIFAGPDSFLNKKFLSNKIMIWFGLISYPLYLWHWPFLSYGRIIYGEETPLSYRFLVISISIFLAWLTVKFVEKPIRFGKKYTALKTISLCLLVFVMGVSGYLLQKMEEKKNWNEPKTPIDYIMLNAVRNCNIKYPKWIDMDGLGTDQPCRIQSENSSIVLVGDSHSRHLYYGFIDGLKNTKESVANFPASCAAPFLNVSTGISPEEKYRENNGRMMNMAYEYVGKTPSVHTVYLAHNPDCSYGEGLAVDLENPNEKNDETVLRNGLIRTLKFLTSKNKNIVIVLDSPSFPYLPGKCKSRGPLLDLFKLSCEVEIISPARDRYKKIVNEVVSKQFPKVKVLDLTPLFCPAGKCSPVVNGKSLFPNNDVDHLNSDGSLFVSKYLLNALR